MKSNLQFDFIADKNNNTITINREFLANRQLVWDCHTKSEFLDQWFAPEPLIAKTKSMDFREGGHWHFVMIDPDGKEYWNWTEYLTIQPIDYYTTSDAFSNENGKIKSDLPLAKWEVTFTDKNINTLVQMKVIYNSLEDLELVINMGMKQGMISTLNRLDKLIKFL